MDQVPVGILHCQKYSYDRELDTVCISCSKTADKKGFYKVNLHDTVLFPEGGGQGADTGTINNVKVYDVQREKLAHVHYTKQPIEAGPVKVKLDWDRRLDHMQQHSGQHLLSAILEQEPYNLKTVGWALKEKVAYVELNTTGRQQPTSEQLDQVEATVNQWIKDATPVICHTKKHSNDEDRPTSLPDDYVGDQGVIRTIEIKGLDLNPCCGTHVEHLGHLQIMKLLQTENIRSGNMRLYFVFGQRVLDSLKDLFDISRQLNKSLSVPPTQFVDSVDRLQLQTKAQAKAVRKWQAQCADQACSGLKAQLDKQSVALVFDEQQDADMSYLNMISMCIKDKQLLEDNPTAAVILASGDRAKGGALIVICEDADRLKQVSAKLMATLQGTKGGGARGRWTGKSQSFEGLETIVDIE
ncbi:ThrRS/AlaRS common domain-containing protein [Hesseltinella vesiculosa]|uniref:ThrRS/AlaRS common domain-containing protein n=1 Tax=Hesseltinella vesiculosa TaxID=101127 RepID=A0A1X2G308_9FUNG|nr:ThrRS/AlaRS common domain-containing protein [Hesseltinella vesiculosa]